MHTLDRNLRDLMRRLHDLHVLFNLYPRFAGVEVARKVQQRQWNLAGLLFSMELVTVAALKVFVKLILRREAFIAPGHGTREVSSLGVSLNVSFEL